MKERLREAIQVWARQHPAFGPYVHADEIDELVARIERIFLNETVLDEVARKFDEAGIDF